MCFECKKFSYTQNKTMGYCNYWCLETDESSQCINFEGSEE